MNPLKRRKLKMKRTPWIKTRYAVGAKCAWKLMCILFISQQKSRINCIRASEGDKKVKNFKIAEIMVETIQGLNSIKIPGAKTK